MNSVTALPLSTTSTRSRLLSTTSTSSGAADRFVASDSGDLKLAKMLAKVTMAVVALSPQIASATDVGAVVSDHVPQAAALFTESHTKIGDYELQFRPADVKINPRLRHGKPGLMMYGDVAEASLVKTTQLADGWTQAQGFRGRIHGELGTFGSNQANVNLEAFRRWEGPLGKDIKGTFEVAGGGYGDILGRSTNVGVHLRQEVNGGHFNLGGQPLSWHLEGKQEFNYRVTGNAPEGDTVGARKLVNYEFLAGVRRDFPISVWGHKGTLITVVGPRVSGDQYTQAHVSPKIDVRARF